MGMRIPASAWLNPHGTSHDPNEDDTPHLRTRLCAPSALLRAAIATASLPYTLMTYDDLSCFMFNHPALNIMNRSRSAATPHAIVVEWNRSLLGRVDDDDATSRAWQGAMDKASEDEVRTRRPRTYSFHGPGASKKRRDGMALFTDDDDDDDDDDIVLTEGCSDSPTQRRPPLTKHHRHHENNIRQIALFTDSPTMIDEHSASRRVIENTNQHHRRNTKRGVLTIGPLGFRPAHDGLLRGIIKVSYETLPIDPVRALERSLMGCFALHTSFGIGVKRIISAMDPYEWLDDPLTSTGRHGKDVDEMLLVSKHSDLVTLCSRTYGCRNVVMDSIALHMRETLCAWSVPPNT
jgi:hypothetical protein